MPSILLCSICTDAVKIVKMNRHSIVTNQAVTARVPKMHLSRLHGMQDQSKVKSWKDEVLKTSIYREPQL